MNQQHEITACIPLLDTAGQLTQPGWARQPHPVYRRADIRAGALRIKQWDSYLITDGHIGLALTIADGGYAGLDSVSFLDFDDGWEQTKSPVRLLPNGKTVLSESADSGVSEVAGGGYMLHFSCENGVRRLSFHMDRFIGDDSVEGEITLTQPPQERLVIAAPFDKPAHFYYSQKLNCMRAEGWIALGERHIELTPDRFFAVLDWQRGVWTYRSTCCRSSASGELDGVPFGWNIGYGFGNTDAASENALFYDGTIHKLGEVTFEIPKNARGKEDYLSPWTFTSDDNRFYMDFTPVLDKHSRKGIFVIESKRHQVFGHFTGRVTLDDGTVLPVRDFFGFAEKAENRW